MDYFTGLLKIANVVLSIFAANIAISFFKTSNQKKELRPWKFLIIALVFFMVQEILGALRAFDVYSSPFLTHIVPTVILGFLIAALILQIHINIRKNGN